MRGTTSRPFVLRPVAHTRQKLTDRCPCRARSRTPVPKAPRRAGSTTTGSILFEGRFDVYRVLQPASSCNQPSFLRPDCRAEFRAIERRDLEPTPRTVEKLRSSQNAQDLSNPAVPYRTALGRQILRLDHPHTRRHPLVHPTRLHRPVANTPTQRTTMTAGLRLMRVRSGTPRWPVRSLSAVRQSTGRYAALRATRSAAPH
jgi:hypothetical protein